MGSDRHTDLLANYVNPAFLTGQAHTQGGMVFFLDCWRCLPVYWALRKGEPSANYSQCLADVIEDFEQASAGGAGPCSLNQLLVLDSQSGESISVVIPCHTNRCIPRG